MTTHTRKGVAAVALLLVAAGAMAEGGVPPEVQMQLDRAEAAASTLTRAEVQAEVLQARQAGMLLAAGEIAEPDSVFVARERYNLAQAREIAERYARIEEENAARVRALALQLEPGRRVASVSNDAALQIITERADGSELTPGDTLARPAEPAMPEPPADSLSEKLPADRPPSDEAPAAPAAAITNDRRD